MTKLTAAQEKLMAQLQELGKMEWDFYGKSETQFNYKTAQALAKKGLVELVFHGNDRTHQYTLTLPKAEVEVEEVIEEAVEVEAAEAKAFTIIANGTEVTGNEIEETVEAIREAANNNPFGYMCIKIYGKEVELAELEAIAPKFVNFKSEFDQGVRFLYIQARTKNTTWGENKAAIKRIAKALEVAEQLNNEGFEYEEAGEEVVAPTEAAVEVVTAATHQGKRSELIRAAGFNRNATDDLFNAIRDDRSEFDLYSKICTADYFKIYDSETEFTVNAPFMLTSKEMKTISRALGGKAFQPVEAVMKWAGFESDWQAAPADGFDNIVFEEGEYYNLAGLKYRFEGGHFYHGNFSLWRGVVENDRIDKWIDEEPGDETPLEQPLTIERVVIDGSVDLESPEAVKQAIETVLEQREEVEVYAVVSGTIEDLCEFKKRMPRNISVQYNYQEGRFVFSLKAVRQEDDLFEETQADLKQFLQVLFGGGSETPPDRQEDVQAFADWLCKYFGLEYRIEPFRVIQSAKEYITNSAGGNVELARKVWKDTRTAYKKSKEAILDEEDFLSEEDHGSAVAKAFGIFFEAIKVKEREYQISSYKTKETTILPESKLQAFAEELGADGGLKFEGILNFLSSKGNMVHIVGKHGLHPILSKETKRTLKRIMKRQLQKQDQSRMEDRLPDVLIHRIEGDIGWGSEDHKVLVKANSAEEALKKLEDELPVYGKEAPHRDYDCTGEAFNNPAEVKQVAPDRFLVEVKIRFDV